MKNKITNWRLLNSDAISVIADPNSPLTRGLSLGLSSTTGLYDLIRLFRKSRWTGWTGKAPRSARQPFFPVRRFINTADTGEHSALSMADQSWNHEVRGRSCASAGESYRYISHVEYPPDPDLRARAIALPTIILFADDRFMFFPR